MGDERIGQGRDNVKKYLEENELVADNLMLQLREIMFPPKKGKEKEETPAADAKEEKNEKKAAVKKSDKDGL